MKAFKDTAIVLTALLILTILMFTLGCSSNPKEIRPMYLHANNANQLDQVGEFNKKAAELDVRTAELRSDVKQHNSQGYTITISRKN